MASRKTPFAVYEWYHCYNRGIDKRIVYEDEYDSRRFLEQLYLANSEKSLRRDDIGMRDFEEILSIPRGEPLVAIGAFCLMPNHFHLVLKASIEDGITTFMQKLGTAYTMYFNARYNRTGNLFLKPFRSRHVDTDRYFQHLINYVHCNPTELYEAGWKGGNAKNLSIVEKQIVVYPYSSLGPYRNKHLPTRRILDETVFDVVHVTPVGQMLQEAREYYREHSDLP